ncbi:hypothetical protein EON65_10615 [archaeon]|nr:MAG: hypothetical protein EON65_10615 [archaeon]
MTSYYKAIKVYAEPVKRKKASGAKDVLPSATYQRPQNTELHEFYELQRRENKAVLRLQQFWRKIRRVRAWRKAVHAMFCVVKIQKIIRGWVARRFVARWFIVRNRTAIIWQSTVRKHLSNVHLRPRQMYERKMATHIQCCARRMIARHRVVSVLRNLAATRIQALWRGVVDRVLADRLWLDNKVIPIQCAARRMVAKNKFSGHHNVLNQAALLIQRKFRTILAARKVGNILHEREMRYRMSLIRMLTAEEEYFIQRINRLMSRVIKNEVREKAQQSLVSIQQQEKLIFEKENEFIETKRQAEIVSPRAIEQGFRDQLLQTADTVRKEITQLKCAHLFDLSMAMHENDEAFEHAVQEIEELADNRAKVAKWREQEYEDRRHLNYHKEQALRRKQMREAVAEERRKWQVRFYTKSGKPDKRRRPGRPWDPSVYAGPEKSTYSGAVGVDLLAYVKSKQKTKPSDTNVQESVDNALNQVTLQTYLDQVNTYQQLLNPLFLILQQRTGLLAGNPLDKAVSANAGMQGFGEEGQKFKEALSSLDVPVPGRTRIKTRGKNEFRTFHFSAAQSSRANTAKANETQQLSSLDKLFGFVPDSRIGTTVTPGKTSPVSRLSTGKSKASRGIDGSAETLDDINFADNIGTYKKQNNLIHSIGSFDLLDSDSMSISDANGDDNELKPMLEGILMPSRRYWKKPAKKYLPADDAFSLPPRPKKEAVLASSAELSPRALPPLILHSRSVTSLHSTSNRPPPPQELSLEMASKVAAEQVAEAKALQERRGKNKEERSQLASRRKEKKATKRRVGTIPWDLLDEIDGAKHKLEGEISFWEFNHKV